MFHVDGSTQKFMTARECAVAHFGTEAVIYMPLLGLWFNGATGQCAVIVKDT